MAENRDSINDAAKSLCNLIAAQLGDVATRDVVKAAGVAAVRSAVEELGFAKTPKALGDARVRQWIIAGAFWTADNGREVDRLEWQGEALCIGLDDAALKLRDAAAFVFSRGRWAGNGLPDDCRAIVWSEKLNNLRPALSRNGGSANMRYHFRTGHDGAPGEAAYFQGTVTRADVAERRRAELSRVEAEAAALNAGNERAAAAIRAQGALPYGPGVEGEE